MEENEESRITPATVAAAVRLGISSEALADILDVYLDECAKEARKRRETRGQRW